MVNSNPKPTPYGTVSDIQYRGRACETVHETAQSSYPGARDAATAVTALVALVPVMAITPVCAVDFETNHKSRTSAAPPRPEIRPEG